MGWIFAIWKSIASIAELVGILLVFWKQNYMKTPQDKIDESNAKTDKEEQDFKDGKGGGDVQI